MADLLLELFSEEIPARMQRKAGDDLARLVTSALIEAGLDHGPAQAFVTPRRLCLSVEGLADRSPDVREERRGPRADAPDQAVDGFCRGAGVSRDALEVREDKKGSFYYAVIEAPGRPANEIIAEAMPGIIRNFPWPKSMRWGGGDLRWVRPLHSILCILGETVVDFEVSGIVAGNKTQGHRFHAPDAFAVTSFDDYREKLATAHVVLDSHARAQTIQDAAAKMARAEGLEVVEDRGLLAEVAGLVEWPVVLMGEIGADFLDLPPEVLQTSMREHQKFFSVRDPKSGKIVRFVTVANRETADDGATILAGNGKVLAARLSDAKFFWENDLRVAREGGQAWLDKLANVTFHNKLGSVSDQIDRIAALAREIAPVVGADADVAEEAARFAKADLSSEMVGEFPELQGLMGRYYAQEAGKSAEVAAAAEEHYAPLGPNDAVPVGQVSVAVALAEKIDRLTGFWAIDEKPTGSKDPFALRRAALGVIRLVLATERNLGICFFEHMKNGLVRNAVAGFEDWGTESAEKSQADIDAWANDLLSFFHDRLKVYLRDQSISHDVIDACLAMPGNDDFTLLVNRARALQAFVASDDGENLKQGYKRAANILSQAEEKDGVEYSYGADVKFAEDDSERALFTALDTSEAAIKPAMEAEDFAAAMTAMAALRAPIDAFFEAVQVNVDNDIVRRNRLNLLSRIRNVMGQVADFSRLEG
ncbi:MAG: glycine--tRNA ligase subunit beta [Pseudomonadota bacterium]